MTTAQQHTTAIELLEADGWKSVNWPALIAAVEQNDNPRGFGVQYRSSHRIRNRRTPTGGWMVSAPPALVLAVRDALKITR